MGMNNSEWSNVLTRVAGRGIQTACTWLRKNRHYGDCANSFAHPV